LLRVSIGGQRIRLRFSNLFGDSALVLAGVHIARPASDGTVDLSSDRALAFGGLSRVTIPAGQSVLSDAIDYDVEPLADLAVTMQIANIGVAVTGHPGSRMTSYFQTGDHVSAVTIPNAVTTDHWYILASLEVVARDAASAIAALGNSITDGRGSGTNKNNRWTDNLARRLLANPATARIAVLNEGLGGNAVIRGGLGPPALARLDRDVLNQLGVRWLIVLEGVNDIGGSSPTATATIADELIAAYKQIIARARVRGIRVYGATILPFGGSMYDSAEHEAARQAVNQWIRTSGAYDAVIDLDAALRDPANPKRLLPDADTGDHLHPNEHGYQLIADAIDLRLFAR
jgi:lysophospholipase L1-like esterase